MSGIVMPIVQDIVQDIIRPVVGYDDNPVIELDLTNTASLTAWNTKYSGSYTRSSSMNVFDYEGVLQTMSANIPAIYGARWTGTEWVNTDTDGSALTNTIGLSFWPTATNVIGSSQYRDFTHADWTKTNGSITTGDVVLIDGTTVSDKNTFTASGADATCVLSAYVSASGVHAAGVFIKRKTGHGAIYLTIDGETTWTEITSEVDTDWNLTQLTMTELANPQFGIKLENSGDAVYLDWAQMDDGKSRVSIHPIEGGTTLAAQSYIIADVSNMGKLIQNKQGYAIAEVQLLPDDMSLLTNAILHNGQYILYSGANHNHVASYDGTSVLNFENILIGYSKAASYWGHITDKKQISAKGSSETAGAYVGNWGSGALYAGSISGSSNFNGIISNLKFGVGIKTTQAKMEAATS